MIFYFKGNCKNGQNCPFSHNRKLMSLISLQKFIAKTLATVCKLIISSPREGAWEKRRQRWKRSEEGERSNNKC